MSSEQRRFEELMAYHCAPTLKGVKIANMFHVSRSLFPNAWELIEVYNAKLKEKGLAFVILQADQPRITFYLYSYKKLQRVLNQPEIQSFLRLFGYSTNSVSACLDHLENRMKHSFYPHEIGIFLGYPYEDVLGFIQDKPCCGIGAWKVYDPLEWERTKRLFVLFDRFRDQFVQAVKKGFLIEQLI